MRHDFPSVINSTSNARLRMRYLAVSHFVDGKSRTKITKYLKVSRVSVINGSKHILIMVLKDFKRNHILVDPIA